MIIKLISGNFKIMLRPAWIIETTEFIAARNAKTMQWVRAHNQRYGKCTSIAVSELNDAEAAHGLLISSVTALYTTKCEHCYFYYVFTNGSTALSHNGSFIDPSELMRGDEKPHPEFDELIKISYHKVIGIINGQIKSFKWGAKCEECGVCSEVDQFPFDWHEVDEFPAFNAESLLPEVRTKLTIDDLDLADIIWESKYAWVLAANRQGKYDLYRFSKGPDSDTAVKGRLRRYMNDVHYEKHLNPAKSAI